MNNLVTSPKNLQVSTVFDQDVDNSHNILYSTSVRNTLMRLLPPHFFLFDELHEGFFEEFSRLLPMIKWSEWGKGGCQVSIYLLCRHRVNGVKFFYEMISRWLMPGKRPVISSFFATDFKLPEISDELFTLSEIVISMENEEERALIRHQLPLIESEIRLGLLSVYHASRILEIKGLSADEKTSLIQERISSLLERRPKDFDHDIFAQMQHFLIMCSEEFKSVREYAHMSRIIYVFYLFRKALKNHLEKNSGQRSVLVKVSKTYLHLAFGLKKVLGVFVALNFQSDNELFEERHFISVLIGRFPHLEVVEDSFFFRSSKEERIQLLYLEVAKEDGTDFSLLETRLIKESLPGEIRNGIEKLARPLFMPRNEEEVMRNIITLSNQLKLSRDLPQVITSFDSQTEDELSFTVIWLRVVKEDDRPIQQAFDIQTSFLKFELDRVKKVGLLRKKYLKEVTVFKVRFPSSNFLRSDHSVDLFKARQSIVIELQRVLGEYRDYNGGMIAKQHEQFLSLKALLPSLDDNDELVLENFFHSIYPVELRSVFNPFYLKKMFTMFLEAVKKNKEGAAENSIFQMSDEAGVYLLLSYKEAAVREAVIDCVREFQIPDFQLLTVISEYAESSYLGYVCLEGDPGQRENFVREISNCLGKLDF